jgi:tetratricopeptide (TPR) repeat protein
VLPLEELRRADLLQTTVLADLEAGRPSRAERRALRVLRVLDTLDRLPDSLDTDRLRVRSLMSLAAARADLRSVDAGLHVLADAAAVVARTGDKGLQAMLDQQHGWLMLGAGRPREALSAFNAAYGQRAGLSDYNTCSVLNGRAFAHADLHDVRAARADWAECARRAEAAGLAEVLCKGLHNVAWADFLAGDLPGALSAMGRAAGMDVDTERGILIMDRGRVLTEAGLLDEADRALQEAEAEFARKRISHERGLAELARAECALLAGQPRLAEQLALRAARRFRLRGSGLARRAELVALHARAGFRGRRERLADRALSLRVVLAESGQHVDARFAGLLAAELLVDEGRLAEARRLLTRDVRVRASDRIGHRLQGQVALTKLALAENDARAARRSIRRGVAELAAHQSIFGSLDLRAASAVHGRRLAALDIEMALSDGGADAVFDAIERARAVSSRLPSVHPPADDATAGLVASLRAIIEEGRESSADDRLLVRRRVELESRISELAWTHPSDTGAVAGSPVNARRIRAALAGSTGVMVAFGRSAGSVYAVVVDANRSRIVDLGRAGALRERITRVRADLDALAGSAMAPGLRQAVALALSHDLAALDAAAIQPLGLSCDHLVVVAGGAVSTVPWGLLPSLGGVAVTVAPSATWWAQVSSEPDQTNVADVTAVALSGPSLTRAESEAGDVASVWGHGRAVTGAAATTDALGAALRSADLVHVAAHGRHERQNPLFSSVRMADGLFFAHELDTCRARQVVLSACDVGLATVRPGDEALGLTSVLLMVGTRTVVASVARFADDVAYDAMVSYHRSLAAGTAPAAALAATISAADGAVPLVCFGLG